MTAETRTELCRIVESAGGVAPDQPTGGPIAEFAVESLLREARREAYLGLSEAASRAASHQHAPEWTDDLRAGIGHTLRIAAEHGAGWANAFHMLLGILADPGSAASRLLADAGRDRAVTMGALHADDRLRQDGPPWLPVIQMLRATGVIADGKDSLFLRMLVRLGGRLMSGPRSVGGYGSPVPTCLQMESVRQAVLFGDHAVRPRHIVLAILSLDAQLAASPAHLPRHLAPVNTAGALLNEHSVSYDAVAAVVEAMSRAETETVTQTSGLFYVSTERAAPAWSVAAAAVWAPARDHADRLGHPRTGTGHLLLALLDDPSGEAAGLLRACDANPVRVCEQDSASLAAIPAA
jgi:hypothetical protein